MTTYDWIGLTALVLLTGGLTAALLRIFRNWDGKR